MRTALVLSALVNSALAAPMRLLMPLARRGIPSRPVLPERGLLAGVLESAGSIPVVGDVLDTVGDIPIVGDVVDSTVALLDPLVGVPLGIGLDLEIDTWLKCGLVSGLFGGRHYDLGCTCAGSSGGLLLEVDVDSVINVAGLDVWVKAEIDIGLGFTYPSRARPTCDGNGGWTCPGGRCGPILIASTVSQASPSSTPSSSASATLPPVSTEATTTSSVSVSSVISTFAVEASSSPSWSSEASPTSSVSTASSGAWTAQPTSSYAVTEDEEDCDEDEDDEPITQNDTPVSAQSYGYTPSWTPASSTPTTTSTVWTTPAPTITEAAYTAYDGETTVVLDTVFVVEKTITVTAPAVTVTQTTTQTQSQTQTITEEGSCSITNEAIPSWTSTWTPEPTSTWYEPSSSYTEAAASSTSWSSTVPTPSPTSSTSSAAPTPSPSAPACGTNQTFDIELNLCVNICLGVLDLLGVCIGTDVATGGDLPTVDVPGLTDLVGGLL